MTEPFYPIPSFYGTQTAYRFEADIFDCEVVGEIPSQLNGALFRAGPDTQYPTLAGDNVINGDGIVSAFYFQDGHADFRCRYVRTERFLAERAARRRLFGKYRNPYTDDPSTKGTDRDNTGNTFTFYHAGKLFALREDSRPHLIDPWTLETGPKFDFEGKLRSLSLTAHPKIDPVTGEWWSFGLFSEKRLEGEMSLQVSDASGNLLREIEFQAPFAGICHDFAVTREHVIIPIMPLTVDNERIRKGGDFYAYDPNQASAWGIIPRNGGADDIRWFSIPGITVGHIMNGYTEGSKIHVDGTVCHGNNFAFYKNLAGEATPFAPSVLSRATFDLSSNTNEGSLDAFEGAVGEMPKIDDRFQMASYRYGFMKTQGGIAKVDWHTRTIDLHPTSNAPGGAQEPIFVPRSLDSAEGDGYLICLVANTRPNNMAELVILDTLKMSEEPVAVVKLPFNQPMAFHGCFVPASELPDAEADASID